jgi:hypothetical protein
MTKTEYAVVFASMIAVGAAFMAQADIYDAVLRFFGIS